MGELGRIEVLARLKRYYMEFCSCEPGEARSTERWAVEELARYIVEHSCEDPYTLILKFSDLMDIYSLKNTETSIYFSEAREIALDFYDEIGGR